MDKDDHSQRENNLQLNQMEDTGNKSYISCSKCDDKFSDQSDFKKHETIHTEQSTQLDISEEQTVSASVVETKYSTDNQRKIEEDKKKPIDERDIAIVMGEENEQKNKDRIQF